MRSHLLSRRTVLAGATLASLAPRLAAAQDGGWFPIELINKKIFAPARFNGTEVRAFLDTGVSSTVLDAGVAEKLGVRGSRQTIMIGWGLEEPVEEAEGLTLEVPSVGVDGVRAVLRPMADLSRSIGEPVEAIVGRALFDNFVVEMDFDGLRARALPRKGYAAPSSSLALRMKPSGGQLAIPIELEGRKLMAAVDLGASMPLSVSAATAKRLGLTEGRPVSTLLANGLGGQQVCAVASTTGLAIGPYTLPSAPVTVFDALNHEAVLGLPVFSRFRLWLDYGGRRMFVAPGADYWAAFEKNRVGLYTQGQADGLMWVTHVSKDSPAQKAGFEIGDRLKRPGGGTTSGMRVVRDAQIMPGQELRYELHDGTMRTVIAADYY